MNIKTKYRLEWIASFIIFAPLLWTPIWVLWTTHYKMTSENRYVVPYKLTIGEFKKKFNSILNPEIKESYVSIFSDNAYLHASIIEFDKTRYILSPLGFFISIRMIAKKVIELRKRQGHFHPKLKNKIRF